MIEDLEFYKKQNEQMVERYIIYFKKWGINWKEYYKFVINRLNNNDYWIWCFLCGFEKFLQEEGWKERGRKENLYKDAESRIWRIIGHFYKNKEYLRNL